MTMRKRWIGLAALAGLLVAEGVAWAECGTCQVCKVDTRAFVFSVASCVIANNQNGSMCCRVDSISFDSYCTMGGNACYGVIVDDGGGGSGGGGGGGGACSYESGWCPPECMSCSGFGRPAI